MKRVLIAFVLFFLSIGAYAQGEEYGCWVSGGGHIGTDADGDGISDTPGAGKAHQDTYGGQAMGMKGGFVIGRWQHTTHLMSDKDKFHSNRTFFVYCWHDRGPGPDVPGAAEANRAIWGGAGKWNGMDGHLFIARAADYKEGKDGDDANKRDAYAITVYFDANGDGFAQEDEAIFSETDCVFGNFQIHMPNRGHPYLSVDLSGLPEVQRILETDPDDLCPDANW